MGSKIVEVVEEGKLKRGGELRRALPKEVPFSILEERMAKFSAGKESSSKTICLEIKALLVDVSRHLYPFLFEL